MDEIRLNQSTVKFDRDSHTYILGDKELKGITSTLIHRAYPNIYEGIPDHVLKEAARKGTQMHESIELYDDLGVSNGMPELESYISIMEERGLKVLATEYLVSDMEHYATAIDKVCVDKDGHIILIDLKRTSIIHYDNVALQLSICKRMFEMLNPELKVGKICVLWLRDEQSRYEELNMVSDEFIDELIKCDLNDAPFDAVKLYGDLPARFNEVEKYIEELEMTRKEIDNVYNSLKKGLLELMEQYNVKQWSGNKVKLTRKLPYVTDRLDSKALKEKCPDVYEKYVKHCNVGGSISVTILK